MQEGDIALAAIPQADSEKKVRPVLLLREMPGRGDYLVCGISTQLHQAIKGFDDVLHPTDPDFKSSGLLHASVIRLGFLGLAQRSSLAGTIGTLPFARHHQLLQRFSEYLLNRS
jgi:mRNA interferase MazF